MEKESIDFSKYDIYRWAYVQENKKVGGKPTSYWGLIYEKILMILAVSMLLVGCGNTDTTDNAQGTEEIHTHAYTENITTEASCEADGNKLGGLSHAQEVKVIGQCNETSWYRIEFDGSTAYVSNSYLQDTKPEQQTATQNTDTQSSTSTECPYELGVWYDMGWYFFKLMPSM